MNNCRSIAEVIDFLISIDKDKIELRINVNNKCIRLILDDVLHISKLLMNLIFQSKLMRSNCLIKIVRNDVEIDRRDITVWLINNDIFRFNMWENY